MMEDKVGRLCSEHGGEEIDRGFGWEKN
jgi:hypothetical protein